MDNTRACQEHANAHWIALEFLAGAVNMAVYLINIGPSMPSNCGILEEVWTDKEANLNHLCIFGCISYVHKDLDCRS